MPARLQVVVARDPALLLRRAGGARSGFLSRHRRYNHSKRKRRHDGDFYPAHGRAAHYRVGRPLWNSVLRANITNAPQTSMTNLPRPNPNEATPAGDNDQWQAFETFVREQHAALCIYAYRYVRSRETAEEVVQDVLLRVWCRRNRMTEVELIPYVYRSVAHAAISRIRTERAIQTRDLALQRQTADRMPGEPSAAADELEVHVRRAIEALPERSRLVFLLSRDAGLTYAAIATRLGISTKTVENHIVRALRLLRAALKPHLLVPFALGTVEQLFRTLR